MKKVLLALLGLVLLAIVSFFCFSSKADAIRSNLLSTTNSALSANKIDGIQTNLQGNDIEMTDIITLKGVVPSQEIKAQAESVVLAVDGVGGVNNQLTVSQEAVMVATEDKESAIKNEATATTTSQEDNQSEVAQTSQATQKRLESYTLVITKDAEGKVVLDGYVDNSDRKKELLEKANALFGSENVTDKLQIAQGAPKEWEYISAFALDRLKDVDYGDMKLHNQSYEFTGHLPTPSSKAAFLDGIRKVMSNPDSHYGRYRGDYIITAPIQEPVTVAKKSLQENRTMTDKSCQESLDSVLKNQKILFDYNKATIKKGSYALLERVFKALDSCKTATIEIAGYTDNTGRSSYNKRLSKLRAASVKKYFVQKGFDSKQLEAIGYGESHPIASNKTAEGRALNRRIEFNVKEGK